MAGEIVRIQIIKNHPGPWYKHAVLKDFICEGILEGNNRWYRYMLTSTPFNDKVFTDIVKKHGDLWGSGLKYIDFYHCWVDKEDAIEVLTSNKQAMRLLKR